MRPGIGRTLVVSCRSLVGSCQAGSHLDHREAGWLAPYVSSQHDAPRRLEFSRAISEKQFASDVIHITTLREFCSRYKSKSTRAVGFRVTLPKCEFEQRGRRQGSARTSAQIADADGVGFLIVRSCFDFCFLLASPRSPHASFQAVSS